jgi:hypothetical protein
MKTSRIFISTVAVSVLAAMLIAGDNVILRSGDQPREFGQEPAPSMVRAVPTFAAFEKGMLPIHAACRSGSIDAVRMLMDRGADMDAKTLSGWTPMHYAAFSGNVQIVRLLASQHCSVKDLTNDGLSPLAIAAMNANIDVMKYLLEQGAEVNK